MFEKFIIGVCKKYTFKEVLNALHFRLCLDAQQLQPVELATVTGSDSRELKTNIIFLQTRKKSVHILASKSNVFN